MAPLIEILNGSMRRVAFATLIGVAGVSARADTVVLEPVRKLAVEGNLSSGKDGGVAEDVSGIACLDLDSGTMRRRCLAVSDESRAAQFVDVLDQKIVVGAALPLIGTQPSDGILGGRPSVSCPGGEAKSGEFDGEGVAYAKPHFYIVGSHGCGRHSGKFRVSSFLLARIRVADDGGIRAADGSVPPPGAPQAALVESTYRLSDALRRATIVGAYFGKELGKANGLNVEGIAVLGDQLLAALRAPSLEGEAYLVSVPVRDLFAPGREPLSGAPTLISLKLGTGIGIRDIAPVPDGRLLVLSGPAQEQAVPSKLFVVDPKSGAATLLGTLASVSDGNAVGKPEAVTVLSATSGELRLLMLFDGLRNGGPREYRVTLPPRA